MLDITVQLVSLLQGRDIAVASSEELLSASFRPRGDDARNERQPGDAQQRRSHPGPETDQGGRCTKAFSGGIVPSHTVTGRLTSYPDRHFRPCELFWHPMDFQTSCSSWVPHLRVQDVYSSFWGVSASLLDRNILGSVSRSQTSYSAGSLQDSPREHISTARILAAQRNGEPQGGRFLIAEVDPGHLYQWFPGAFEFYR